MHSPIARGKHQVAAPYLLIERDRAGRVIRTRAYDTLQALAEKSRWAVYRLTGFPGQPRYNLVSDAGDQAFAGSAEAWSPGGRRMCVNELAAYGRRLAREAFANRYGAVYVHRSGPVPGTGRRSGGRYYRRMATMAERRLNALVLVEEGEVAARPVRCGRCLPSDWDDYVRHKERSWKSQHKGRKAWDRGDRPGRRTRAD